MKKLSYQTTIILFFSLMLLIPAKSFSQPEESREQTLQRVDALLAEGDNQQAWHLLEELPEIEAAPDDKLWRMARVQYEIGRLAEKNALAFFEEAEKIARSAIAKNDMDSNGYKWLAIALGAKSKLSGKKTQIRLSKEIKKNIDKALTLAPEDDIAYLVLSRWHYKIAGIGFFSRAIARLVYGKLPEASLDQAEKLLWKAISLKDRIAHRYNLAKVLKRMGRKEEALAQLRLALLLPVTFPEEEEELRKTEEKLKHW